MYLKMFRQSLHTLSILSALLLALVFSVQLSHAQGTTASVSGTVSDPSGAVVPGAKITATNTATGLTYLATTDGAGLYRIPQLPPGSYTLQVSSSGFGIKNLAPFTLLVDQQSQQNISLSPGAETQTVSVSASSLLLDPLNTSQGQVIQNRQIVGLPLNGRDFLQLAQLSAGVTPIVSGISSPASQFSGTTTVSISIGGLREDDNSYLYDGVETRNAWYGEEGLLPSIDLIQEFKVEQIGSSAAFGDAGAFINTVTKSGTNEYHGTAFEFLRNNDFDARNYFDVGAAPPFHQNQFGGTFGGPIKKNKLFFFLNYEGFRQIQPVDNYNIVPTADQRAGNFSADKAQIYNPFTGAPFTGNIIPNGLFSPGALTILNYFPLPNGSYPDNANYFNLSDTTDNWNQETARIDYTINPANTVFARFTLQSQATSVGSFTPTRTQVFPTDPKNVAIGYSHTFSPNLVNTFHFGWSHTSTGQNRVDGFDAAQANPLGLINEEDQSGSYGPPSFNFSGYGNPGSSGGTEIVREGLFAWTDSLLIQKGKQSISIGADIRYDPIYLYEDWAATSLSFNGSYTNDSIADLLLGIPDSATTAIGDPTLNLRSWYQGYYLQDNVHATPKLNLNLGIRYDYHSQPVDTANHVGTFDFATGQDLSYPATNVLGLGRNEIFPVYTNVSPRIGFNYTPDASGHTDIKGGFGIYFLQANVNQYEVEVDTTKYYLVNGYNNTPAVTRPAVYNPAAPIVQPLDFTLGQLFTPNLPGGLPTASFENPHNTTPYTYEWNLAVDQTVGNWLFEVSYLASAGRHIETRANLNPLLPSGTTPVPGYNGLQENLNAGSSIYNGVVGRVEHRFHSGFSLLGSYTFAKCLSTPWQDQFSWHPLDLHLDYGHCAADLNQLFTANGLYQLPFGQGKMFLNRGGWLNQAVGGWELSGIASLHSGPWETLGSNQNLGIFVNALPNVTGPVNNTALNSGLGRHLRLGPYFNTGNVAAISTEAVQGNAGVQNIIAPGSADFDFSLDKEWRVAERYGLTFRGDFFNIFNRVNFTGLDTNVDDSTFGFVSGANPAREIQLSLRATF